MDILALCFAQPLCCIQRTLIRAGTRNRLGPFLIESTSLSHQAMSFSTIFQLCFQTSLPSIFWSPLHPLPCFRTHSDYLYLTPILGALYAFATIGVSGNIHSLRTCPSGSSFNSAHHRPWISIGPPSTFASGSWDLLSICVNMSSWI